MIKFIKFINPIITGFFFLIWSMNAFFVFGDAGRHISLFVGFLLILLAALLSPDKKGITLFFTSSLLLYFFYILLAVIQNQKTLSSTNLIFGFVCLGLLNAGYILGKNKNVYDKLPSTMIYLFSLLTILGSLYFIQYQATSLILFRNFGFDDSVNAIGIAYTHGILFLLFVSFYYLKKDQNVIFKTLILLTLLVLLMVIISTQSKGAIIFLVMVFLLLKIKSLRIENFSLIKLSRFLILIFLIIISFAIVQNKYPVAVFKTLLVLSLAVLIGLIISTQKRGSIIFLINLFLIGALKGVRLIKHSYNKLFRVLIILFLFIVFSSFFQDNLSFIIEKTGGAINRFERLLSFSQDFSSDQSAVLRAEMYNNFFKELPSLIFIGQKEYRPYPHNQFMEIIMRWGIFGIPLLILSIYTIIRALRLIKINLFKYSPFAMVVLIIFIFSYLQSMTSLALEMNRMLWFGFGFLISYKEDLTGQGK